MKEARGKSNVDFNFKVNALQCKSKRVKQASISLEDLFSNSTRNQLCLHKRHQSLPFIEKESQRHLEDAFDCSIEYSKLYIEYVEIVSFFNSISLKWHQDLTEPINNSPPTPTFQSEIMSSFTPAIDSIISESNDRSEAIEALFSDITHTITDIIALIFQSQNNKVNAPMKKPNGQSKSDLSCFSSKTVPGPIHNASYMKYIHFQNSKEPKTTLTGLKKTKPVPLICINL